jgi:hypothetical protein
MSMDSFSVIKRNPEHAAQVRRILELPNDNWSDLKVEFGLGIVGLATVTIILTGEQTVALAALAVEHVNYDILRKERDVESIQRDLVDG